MHSNREVSAASSENDCYKEIETAIYQRQEQVYPIKTNRHGLFSINYLWQQCYTKDEENLLARIKNIHRDKDDTFFSMNTYSSLYEMYRCITPKHSIPHSFTLPTQEAQDDKLYPIFDLSHSIAKQIANNQAERSYGQNFELMNDPTMLAMEELKNWFLISLATSECKTETLAKISDKKNYLKNLFYEITDFGKDKLTLRAIEEQLSSAEKYIHQCISQQQTPELLRELIRNSKNLESIISNYLHFLLIDEQVSDNFTSENLLQKNMCDKSPLCYIFEMSMENPKSDITNSRIITVSPQADYSGNHMYQIGLQSKLLDGIKFADFVTSSDKETYLKTVGHLEMISGIRESLQQFSDLQTKLGSYQFAYSFLNQIEKLGENYIKLIDECRKNIFRLLEVANKGVNQYLSKQNKKEGSAFIKNLRLLETKIANGDSAKNIFSHKVQSVSESMHHYQNALKLLVESIESGQAKKQIGNDIIQLSKNIYRYNYLVEAFLNDQDLISDEVVNSHPEFFLDDSSIESKPNILQSCPAYPVEWYKPELFDTLIWDETIKIHEDGEAIFTLKAFKKNELVGEIDLYGQTRLCVSADGSQSNLVGQSGMFKLFNPLSDNYQLPVCDHLPPGTFAKALSNSINSAGIGMARGTGSSIGKKMLQMNYSKTKSILANQITFISLTFGVKLAENYYYKGISDPLSCILNASLETGDIIIANTVVSSVSTLIAQCSNYIKAKGHHSSSTALNGISSLISSGLFMYQSYQHGIISTGASAAVGIGVENSSDSLLSYFLGC